MMLFSSCISLRHSHPFIRLTAEEYERQVRKTGRNRRCYMPKYEFVVLYKCEHIQDAPPIIFPDCKFLFLERNAIEFNRLHVDEVTFPSLEGIFIHGSMGTAYAHQLFPTSLKWTITHSSPIMNGQCSRISHVAFKRFIERAEKIGNIDPEHRITMIDHVKEMMRRGRSRTESSSRATDRRGSEMSIVSVML